MKFKRYVFMISNRKTRSYIFLGLTNQCFKRHVKYFKIKTINNFYVEKIVF